MSLQHAWPLLVRPSLHQSIPSSDRIVRNNTHSEVLVFHQTLSTPKSSYIRRILSSTLQERAHIIHVFSPGSNNENEFTILSPFHTIRVHRNTLLQYQVQSAEFKQRNWNKHLAVRYKDLSVPTRRILHSTTTPQAAPAIGVNKPWVHNVLTRLTH